MALVLVMFITDFISTVKKDASDIIAGKSRVNVDVFLQPWKYVVCLPLEKLTADPKVSRQGVEFYKQKIAHKEKLRPIIVVKHPHKDTYAVLDGHHRFYAYKESGIKKVNCALAGDYSSVIFYLTEHGYFQPSPEFTEGIRQPAIQLHENLKQFLTSFSNGSKGSTS
jgi:hypothetical protein